MKYITFFTILLLALSLSIAAQGRRVLFIGDSITDGAWGNTGIWNSPSEDRSQTDMNHIYGHGYMMIAASHYQGLFPQEEWTFWNRGISGNTLFDLAKRWEKDALALNPDVISILIGTNDVDKALGEGKAIDFDAWENQYRRLLDAILEKNKDATFMLCTPFVAKAGRMKDPNNFDKRKAMISVLVGITERIAKDYPATLVPFHALVNSTIAANENLPTEYWIWDGIHPTPAMHYLMAQQWIKAYNSQSSQKDR